MDAIILKRIQTFQRYILDRYSRRLAWTDAEALIQAVADEVSSRVENKRLPIGAESIAQELGIAVKSQKAIGGHAAELVPRNGGLMAVYFNVTTTLSPRERFSIAHECGHALFYSWDEGAWTDRRLIPRAGMGYWDSSGRGAREEGLCDAFARAALVPRHFAIEMTHRPASLRDFIHAARALRVSGEVLARRLLYDLDGWRNSSICRVIWSAEGIRASCFHGAATKRNRISATALERLLEGIAITRAEQQIRRALEIDEDTFESVASGKTVWLRFDVSGSSALACTSARHA